jgi:FdhE protein
MGALMLERLQELHRRLQALSHAFPGEDPHRAAEEVVRVVREVWPDFLGNLSGRLGPGLVDDLAKVEEGQWPEDPGYAFLLHQVRRLTSPGPLPRQEGMADRCPACGGVPDVGFLDEEGRRYYVCATCDTPWRAPRLACPSCGETRPDRLVFYAEDPYRLYVCQSCGERFVVQDLRLNPILDLAALRARSAWYAIADVEV